MKYIKMIVASMVLFVATFSFANAKDDLTVLNTGSKTGGFSQQSLAYYTDLSRMKEDFGVVNLVNPGNKCVAVKSLLPKIDGPVLFPWGSDMEAQQRTDKGCGATVDITNGTVVRFVEKFQYLCQANGKLDITRNNGKIGYNASAAALPKTIAATNDSFGRNHKKVGYDGWGAAIIALLNNEVDYIIVSPPGNAQVEAKGGSCMPLSSGADSLFAKDTKNKNADLVASNIDAWLVLNVTDAEANALTDKLRKIHFECDTAISTWQKGCDSKGTAIQNSEFDINKSHFTRWENSVNWNTIK
jgi:hypothetical protein